MILRACFASCPINNGGFFPRSNGSQRVKLTTHHSSVDDRDVFSFTYTAPVLLGWYFLYIFNTEPSIT
jgi:hypothetical protein